MQNEIYLRRKNKVLLNRGNVPQPNNKHIATIIKNIESLGYTVSKDIFDILQTLSTEQLANFYFEIVDILRRMVGAHRAYRPMYPNFPQQVMDATECELFINAVVHYISCGEILPDYEKEERFPLIDFRKLTVIELGTKEEFDNIFTNLLSSKTSISQTDKVDIEWFFSKYKNKIITMLPKEITMKENAAFMAGMILKYVPFRYSVLFNYFKTATDVLRLAVAMSDGDISLATNSKFRNFKRKERRLLLSLLENCNNIEEDMMRHKTRWITLAAKLHPFEAEYDGMCEKVRVAVEKLRRGTKIEVYGGKVEALIANKDNVPLISLLKQRPGEFARRLDHVLRTSDNPYDVLVGFESVASEVPAYILLQLKKHFEFRNHQAHLNSLRTFFPKGDVAKLQAIENNLPELYPPICMNVIRTCEEALLDIFSKGKPLGKVYIDERMSNFIVPFSQRSASKSLKALVRGSKVPIPDEINTIRSFIYWKGYHVDIDLSIVLYNKDWDFIDRVSFRNVKLDEMNAYHSGDITSAPYGASEFIDIDMKTAREKGVRYVLYALNVYSGPQFANMEECFMGWMAREDSNSGEIYEPTTVENKADITSKTKIAIPMVLDLEERKMIWSDLALKHEPEYVNDVDSNEASLSLMGQSITSLNKPNLYDLFRLHAEARGTICDSIEEADTVFSLDKGITPYDIDVIISQFL